MALPGAHFRLGVATFWFIVFVRMGKHCLNSLKTFTEFDERLISYI